jgi:endonuclease G
MKYILFLITAFFTVPVHAWEQYAPYPIEKCQVQSPYGFPQTAKQGVAICRAGYVTLNDTTAKLPVWVSYTLYPEYALGCVPRSNGFAPDQSLPKGSRAELVDFKGSGYDIGHVVPNADQSRFDQTEKESFLLTNMVAQLPGTNRGIIKLTETNIRGWVTQRNHPYVIYSGPLYGPGDKTIGLNQIVVPHAFYKIVIDTTTNEVAGFLIPHVGNQGNDLTKVRAPIDQIQQLSGVQFAYPANAVELPLNYLWPVDYKALTEAKRAACKGNAN